VRVRRLCSVEAEACTPGHYLGSIVSELSPVELRASCEQAAVIAVGNVGDRGRRPAGGRRGSGDISPIGSQVVPHLGVDLVMQRGISRCPGQSLSGAGVANDRAWRSRRSGRPLARQYSSGTTGRGLDQCSQPLHMGSDFLPRVAADEERCPVLVVGSAVSLEPIFSCARLISPVVRAR